MSHSDPIPRAVALQAQADVVFCIDVTASMASCIQAVRDHADVFVNALKGVDYRLRLIAYRDLHDPTEKGPAWLIGSFTNSLETFRTALSSQRAEGGGESRTGESTLDALQYAVHSEWRKRQCHKTIIVFTDDIPHPTLHPSTPHVGPCKNEYGVLKDFQKLAHSLLYLVAPDHEIYQRIVEGMRNARGDRKVFFHVIKRSCDAGFDGLRGVEWRELLSSLGKRVSESSSAAAQYEMESS
jgi:hypothetical protein